MDNCDIVSSKDELEKLKKSKIITHLCINFNQEIEEDDLPKSLTHLTFGSWHQQTIKHTVLPNSIN